MKEAIKVVKSLSYDDQKILLNIIEKRLKSHRRDGLIKAIAEAREAYQKGYVKRGTVDDLMRDLEI